MNECLWESVPLSTSCPEILTWKPSSMRVAKARASADLISMFLPLLMALA